MSRKQLPNKKELVSRVREILESLQEETDRGAAIVGESYLSDALDTLLLKIMINDPKAAKALLNGSLRKFNARIELAYCLGYVSERIRDKMHIIGQIRNEFAHTNEDLHYDSDRIRSYCNGLSSRPLPASTNSGVIRKRFMSAVVQLAKQVLLLAHSPLLKPWYHPVDVIPRRPGSE